MPSKYKNLVSKLIAIMLSLQILGLPLASSNAAAQEAASAPPRLFRVILPVPDIENATRFYQSFLAEKGERISPGRHYFMLGQTILAIYDPVADGDPLGEAWVYHENQYIYLAVSDLEEAAARAQELGATIIEPIGTRPWGERSFCFQDPFGSHICIVDETTLFLGSGKAK